MAGSGGALAGSGGAIATSGGIGGSTGAGGRTALGGAANALPCTMTARDVAPFCIDANNCALTQVNEIACRRDASQLSLALASSAAWLGFSGELDSSGTRAFIVGGLGDAGRSLERVASTEHGRVFSNGETLAGVAWQGMDAHWLDANAELADPIALPSGTVWDVALGTASRAHFLMAQTIENATSFDVVTSDGELTHVYDGAMRDARLISADPLAVAYAIDAPSVDGGATTRLFRSEPPAEAQLIAEIPQQPRFGRLSTAPNGSALAFDLMDSIGGSNPTAAGLVFVDADGVHDAWRALLKPSSCHGQYTAYNPDICKSDVSYESLGESSLLGLHALTTTSDGNVWLARLSGSLETRCSWVSVSGCFETLPCDCRRKRADEFVFSLALYRAPNFDVPLLTLGAPGRTSAAELAMTSLGTRIAIAVSNRRAYDSKIFWLELDTAKLP